MSRRPLFLKTSDWHLQRGAWKRANTPKGDAFFALRQLYRLCLDLDVDLLGAGDLFDDLAPDTETLDRAFRFVNDMQRAEKRVVFTQGQHEKAYPAYLSLHPYPKHAHRLVTHVRGVAVYGMDHVPPDQLAAEAERVPAGADVLMCHQVWGEFMGVGAEGSLTQLLRPGGPNVVLTGDYHAHQVLDVEGTKVYSPGSTCLQSIDEPRAKQVFLFYDDFSVESVPLKTRPVFDYLVRDEEDLEQLLAAIPEYFLVPDEALPEEMRKPLIYVQCGAVDQAWKRVARAVGDKAFVFWKPLVGEAGDVLVDPREAARAVPLGMTGCLPLVTPEGGPVYNSTLRLLQAPDKKVELAAMAAEFGRS